MTHNAETSAHANWDAQRYDRVARPHAAWGATVLDRLSLDGDEVVLDAGCGSGRITAQLLERLPRGRVIAADNSPTMLAEARVTLAPFGARAEVVEADLVEIDTILDAPVDAIFSTAVFHWIADHERLFAALRRVVRAGGLLVAQCGGAGNLAQFMAAADDVVARPAWRDTFAGQHLWRHYYTPEVTEQQMRAAGFATVEAGLEPSPQTFVDDGRARRLLPRRGADEPRLEAAGGGAGRLRRRGGGRGRGAAGRLHTGLRPARTSRRPPEKTAHRRMGDRARSRATLK